MIGDGGYWCACVRCEGPFWGGKYSVMCPTCKAECKALAAGSRRAKTPQAVECEASQSGHAVATPNPLSPSRGNEE
jgi:hypothetical protein